MVGKEIVGRKDEWDAAVKIALSGASLDTSSMGVSALFETTLAGIHKQLPEAEFIVFDNALGRCRPSLRLSEDESMEYTAYGTRK